MRGAGANERGEGMHKHCNTGANDRADSRADGQTDGCKDAQTYRRTHLCLRQLCTLQTLHALHTTGHHWTRWNRATECHRWDGMAWRALAVVLHTGLDCHPLLLRTALHALLCTHCSARPALHCPIPHCPAQSARAQCNSINQSYTVACAPVTTNQRWSHRLQFAVLVWQ